MYILIYSHQAADIPGAQAWSARWWMAHFGAKTPKRHVAWSNSSAVGFLDMGKLVAFNRQSAEYQKHKTAKTTNKNGKKQFSGRKK